MGREASSKQRARTEELPQDPESLLSSAEQADLLRELDRLVRLRRDAEVESAALGMH